MLLGWVCLICSFVINFQLTLAIILAFVIMLITINGFTNKDKDDIEDVLEVMNTSLDEIKDVAVLVFVGASLFIMWVVTFHRFLMAI